MRLNVLTPERKAVFDQEVLEVSVPAQKGEITILPGHSALITILGTGILSYKVKGSEKHFKAVISSGYCEVVGDQVNVLAEFMQAKEEIVAETEEARLKAAEKKLVTEVLDDEQYQETITEVARTQSALSMVWHH